MDVITREDYISSDSEEEKLAEKIKQARVSTAKQNKARENTGRLSTARSAESRPNTADGEGGETIKLPAII